MTSSDDFHLLSWQNFFAFAAVLGGAILPILIRRRWPTTVAEIDPRASTARDVEEPQTRELSTLSTVIFEATDFDGVDPETPVGSLGLIGIGRTPATADLWDHRRISLLLVPSDHDRRRGMSFEYVDMVPVELHGRS